MLLSPPPSSAIANSRAVASQRRLLPTYPETSEAVYDDEDSEDSDDEYKADYR